MFIAAAINERNKVGPFGLNKKKKNCSCKTSASCTQRDLQGSRKLTTQSLQTFEDNPLAVKAECGEEAFVAAKFLLRHIWSTQNQSCNALSTDGTTTAF